MPAVFTVTCDAAVTMTPQVAVATAPDTLELVDQELESYPDPDYDDFGRPLG